MRGSSIQGGLLVCSVRCIGVPLSISDTDRCKPHEELVGPASIATKCSTSPFTSTLSPIMNYLVLALVNNRITHVCCINTPPEPFMPVTRHINRDLEYARLNGSQFHSTGIHDILPERASATDPPFLSYILLHSGNNHHFQTRARILQIRICCCWKRGCVSPLTRVNALNVYCSDSPRPASVFK
ncbi:uncharacterized protein EI90DRAFT_3037923 [Cantharellus anzutake]|uniref:uncharacterized protein n=1 Tax=Cantharellus anzutake TaxID=1750568 RepID=UPI0019053F77|nr:uncharacterized protein EI90DRAFT_3037923 [Cantharellus anzutake]KAF8339833.1 hypothetical protein EI90DRAFT_3037923 [Cantharellus anzutake]